MEYSGNITEIYRQ